MKSWIFVAGAVWLLSACQQSSVTVRDEAGGTFRAVQGSVLVVNQEVRVPAGRARVFLQNDSPGGTQFGSAFDSYRPHCALEVRSVDHDGFTIRPGTFTVTRVQRVIEQVVMHEPIRVAGLNLAAGGLMGGSQSLYDGYHFWLVSEDQPDVRRLSCFGVYAQPFDLQPPTLQEIAGALGAVAEIRR